MRLESKQTVKVKDTIIGGKTPLICLPIVAEEKEDLLAQASAFMPLDPDLIEWRIDGFKKVLDIPECISALKELQAVIGSVPVIFTCRTDAEGGMQAICEQDRLNLILEAMKTGLVDILDTEACNSKDFINSVIKAAKASDTKVILSCHDFEKTPSKTFIMEKLAEEQDLGADIAKFAVMPNTIEDVLTMMEATMAARNGRVKIPMVTMSMGEMGAVSRISGGVFGSDVTFAIGKNASAPGQIPIKELRQAMSVLYS